MTGSKEGIEAKALTFNGKVSIVLYRLPEVILFKTLLSINATNT